MAKKSKPSKNLKKLSPYRLWVTAGGASIVVLGSIAAAYIVIADYSDRLELAKQTAEHAHALKGVANSSSDWHRVADRYEQAIARLEEIPSLNKSHPEAQALIDSFKMLADEARNTANQPESAHQATTAQVGDSVSAFMERIRETDPEGKFVISAEATRGGSLKVVVGPGWADSSPSRKREIAEGLQQIWGDYTYLYQEDGRLVAQPGLRNPAVMEIRDE